jgi:dienelactone hydrolase
MPLALRCFALVNLVVVAVVAFTKTNLAAEIPRVLSQGQLPADKRLDPPKDLDGYFPFAVPKSVAEWNKRAERVKRQMLVSQGLWPMPTAKPLNPVIHGKIEQGDYTVERAYFESFPGFYVTGSLYRPVGKSGKLPAVLCPHGHWANGRFHDAGRKSVREQIVQGGERFEEGGRSPLQARCVQLARMGCVVFHYDMIGYADSQQISFEIAHRFSKQRPEMNTTENWGLYSPQAEANLQSVMGLQTYNSIRALDFLLSLPDVDPARIGVTGASGGGTQTFMLGAVDPRPAAVFPAVMVSTAMQGGCTCENSSCLRVETGNIEFAALFAPKPQGMTAADDWTKEMQTKGFPELKEHYKLLGAPNNVMLKAALHFGHNYNYVSRSAMYGWFNKHLNLGLEDPVVEEDYKRLTTEEMTVWDAEHPKPAGGPDFERKLLAHWKVDAEKQLAALAPTDTASLNKWREVVGGAADVLVGRGLPAAMDVEYQETLKADQGSYSQFAGLLRNKPKGEELPIAFLHPKEWKGSAVIWIDEQGKAGLFGEGGELKPEIKKLLEAGVTVVGVDLLFQGEFLKDGQPPRMTRKVKNPREFAGYTFGFNHTLFAQRAQDILTVVAFVKNHELEPKTVALVGLGDVAGPLVAAARAQARDAVERAVVDTRGFRFAKLFDFQDSRFLPGGAKYGDVPGFLSLSAPGKLWLAGEGADAPPLLASAYKAAGASTNLTVSNAKPEETTAAAVKWLLTK